MHTAEPEDDAAFELLDDLNIRSEPEHTDAERCGQCVEVIISISNLSGLRLAVLVGELGLLLPMKRHSFRQASERARLPDRANACVRGE